MSHEIRTPMNSVLGMAHLALRSGLDERQRDYVEKIQTSGQHLLAIINDILDMSKIESGKLELDRVDFRLESLFRNVSTLMGDKAREKNLRFVTDMDPALAVTLHGDALRISQVLINFTGNAIKFTERGQVTLRARLMKADESAFQIRFEVEDSGIGLSAEACARLFQSFAQADATTTRKYGGTGLGLAISSKLIELMGGKVGVDSTPGKGSTFWASVCLERGQTGGLDLAAVPDVSAAQNAQKLNGVRILLTEDNPFNQQVASEMLADVGCVVCIASSGTEALNLLEKQRFDCVLMDVQMPGMDGLEATRRIRANAAWKGLPIIAMTANAFSEDREQCLAVGMDDFISKPVQLDKLCAAIGRFTQSESEDSASEERATQLDEANRIEPSEAPCLDVAVLAQLGRNKPEKMARFLKIFHDSLLAGSLQMHAACTNGEFEVLSDVGHRLKSSARWVGAMRLGEQLERIEFLRSENGIAAADQALNELTVLIEEFTLSMNAWLDEQGESVAT